MSQIGLWGWDGGNHKWIKALSDDAGHLQVDVVSSTLPTGASTSALQATSNTALGNILTALGAGLPIALDTLSLKVREQGTPDVHCGLEIGGTWYGLRGYSAAHPNLVVQLAHGGDFIGMSRLNATIPEANYALDVAAAIHCKVGAVYAPVYAWAASADGVTGAQRGMQTTSYLFGYNGATWDRLRTYATGILKVGRAEVGLLTARLTATGQVGAVGARKLYWILLNPGVASSLVEITDAAAGGAAVKLDHFDTTRDGHMLTFDPPVEFTTGIYLETFTNMTSAIFGYL